MKKNNYKVIGMMSGTSLDGIDLVDVIFHKDEQWHFKIKNAQTIPYSSHWRKKLQDSIYLTPDELKELDEAYAVFVGDEINKFIRKHAIKNLDAVCTHGHTVFHQPEKRITLQIGNTPKLAQHIGHTLVCDFRTQDVELGGQGAPLVPIGDQLLLSEYTYCLNLGGFANVSFDDKNGKRIAFDICPANIVLNHYAAKLGKIYDAYGEEASQGKVNELLLHDLNQLAFYTMAAPKSLGIEWVKAVFLPLIESSPIAIKDILSTLVTHIAMQIAKVFKKKAKVLVTGGGVYNRFLMDRIREVTSSEIVVPEDHMVAYKEAVVFGLLGVLRLRGEVNCLKSATGASVDHSSGKIFES